MTTKSGSVLISSKDDDGRPPFILSLSNVEGVEIENLTGWWEPDYETAAPWNQDLSDLYDNARRHALNIDSVAKGILSEVGETLPAADDDDIAF